jgi:hypothetical protein
MPRREVTMTGNILDSFFLETSAREQLECPGVGRDKDCDTALQFYFSRRITDDEMRHLHTVMQRAVAMMLTKSEGNRHG